MINLFTKEEVELIILNRKYNDIAAQWRGKVLNDCIQLEIKLEEFLAYYFCGKNASKRNELLTFFIENETNFNTKIKVCYKIFKGKPDDKEYQFERVKGYLDNARKIRNIVAHSELTYKDFLKKVDDKTTVFKDVFKNNQQLEISEKFFENFVAEWCYCYDFFRQEIHLIERKPLSYKAKP